MACTFIMPCGSCFHCKRGEEDTCAPFFALNRLKGQLYDGSTRLYDAETGTEPIAMYSFAGLAEYAVVPETAAFLLPPLLAEKNFAESSLLGCAFFTAMGAIRNAADLRGGQSLVIIGAGGVGQGIVQLAKHLGAGPIIAVDISPKALDLAKSFGADHCVDASKEDVLERIAAATEGYKADVCIEVIGSKATFEQAVMAVRARRRPRLLRGHRLGHHQGGSTDHPFGAAAHQFGGFLWCESFQRHARVAADRCRWWRRSEIRGDAALQYGGGGASL